MILLPFPACRFLLTLALAPAVMAASTHDLLKKPGPWYATSEAKGAAANILSYQSDYGGWPKSNALSAKPFAGKPVDLVGRLSPSFDNGATTDEVRFMAHMFQSTKEEHYRRAVENGIDYILISQSPTGGWPLMYPPTDRGRITLNEHATEQVMLLLQEIGDSKDFSFLDAERLHGVKLALGRKEKAEASSWQPKVRIALAGDSTVKDEGGWGFGFKKRLGPDVLCENFAQGGQSSKSFRDTGWWEKALACKPDYVLIQFGHNDGPGKGANRETYPATTYPENLTRFIAEAREAGVKPILVTSLARRIFQPDGKLRGELAPYVEATRKVAKEQHVPLIDLYARSKELVEKLGPAGIEPFEPKILPKTAADPQAAATFKIAATDLDVPPSSANARHDGTHLTARGSIEFGAIVAQEFSRVMPESTVEFKHTP